MNWLDFISSIGLSQATTIIVALIGVATPSVIAAITYMAKNRIWVFGRQADLKPAVDTATQVCEDIIVLMEFRRIELENIISNNMLTLLNTVIYPYILNQYIRALPTESSYEEQRVLQPANSSIRSGLDELMYVALRENGFSKLTGVMLSNYCSTKAESILSLVSDKCMQFLQGRLIGELRVFDPTCEHTILLKKQIVSFLGKERDESSNSEEGLVRQIIRHSSSTARQKEDLRMRAYSDCHVAPNHAVAEDAPT